MYYIIFGIALSIIILRIIKASENNSNNNQNTTNNITVKDGMNLYFGKVLGKLFIIIILLLIIFFIIPLFL